MKVRNILSEHLNEVVRTNMARCALHEVGLGSLEKIEKDVAHGQEMCVASWNLLNIIIIGLSMIGLG